MGEQPKKTPTRERARGTQSDMIDIQIKQGGDPALAQMIASTHGEDVRDPAVEQVATLLREHQEEDVRSRPSHHELQTVDFDKLDPDNDWSDV
jgi:hypothetical protein